MLGLLVVRRPQRLGDKLALHCHLGSLGCGLGVVIGSLFLVLPVMMLHVVSDELDQFGLGERMSWCMHLHSGSSVLVST